MGLLLPEAGITETVFPSILFMCTVRKGFDWAGPAPLADHLQLTNQGAFAKCVSQCLNVPAPIALSVVFNSPLYRLIFPEAGA